MIYFQIDLDFEKTIDFIRAMIAAISVQRILACSENLNIGKIETSELLNTYVMCCCSNRFETPFKFTDPT